MLILVMFLNGLAIMVLEMVGARLLAPWLGTSVIVWTSLIGVILASLSLGYWLGGRLADATLRLPLPDKNKQGKSNSHAAEQYRKAHILLANILMAAAICVIITACIQSFTLQVLSQAIPSIHLAAIIAALVLFAAPSVLCGMVSPYATRLAITHSDNAGAIIGKLNAVATVGSIAGTFLGGFILVSWFGSTTITLGVAACFIAAAMCIRVQPLLPKLSLLLLIAAGITASTLYASAQAEKGEPTIETAYNTIRIQQGTLHNRAVRLLMTNPGSYQSAAFFDNPTELVFQYTQYYAIGTALTPQAQRILMLGGGGYSVPKWLFSKESGLAATSVPYEKENIPQKLVQAAPSLTIPTPTAKAFPLQLDVVELDKGITKAAQDYFWAPSNDPRIHIFHEDARTFLNRAYAEQKKNSYGPYDLIFADIFNSHYTVPFHVGTQEAAQKIHSLLSKDGIVLMNIITAVEGDNGRLFRSIYHAFASSFDQLIVLPVQNPQEGERLQNVMLMGLRTARPLPDAYELARYPQVAKMLQQQWTQPIPTDVPPLTDDFAPVERYTMNFVDK